MQTRQQLLVQIKEAVYVCVCVEWGEVTTFDSSTRLMWKMTAAAAKSFQSCPSLCDPMDGSPPGPAVPGVL